MYKINTKIQTSKELNECIELYCFQTSNKTLTNVTLYADDAQLTIMSLDVDTLRALQTSISAIVDQDNALQSTLWCKERGTKEELENVT